jgi:hypothetical protein
MDREERKRFWVDEVREQGEYKPPIPCLIKLNSIKYTSQFNSTEYVCFADSQRYAAVTNSMGLNPS